MKTRLLVYGPLAVAGRKNGGVALSREKQGTLALGVVNAGHKAHRWRDSAISVAVVGAMIAVACYLGCSPARQEDGVGASSNDAEQSVEVRDCIRVRRIEIVEDAGRVVGVVRSVGRGEDSSAYLELLAHGDRGDRKGRLVHIWVIRINLQHNNERRDRAPNEDHSPYRLAFAR